MKNILIIGGSSGGATLGAELRRQSEDTNITIIEQGPDISYGNCSLPYYFSNRFESIDDLIINTPEDFKSRYNIDVYTNTQALEILKDDKKVLVEDLEKNEKRQVPYDVLILSTGASAVKPKDLDAKNSFTLRNVQDVRDIDNYIQKNKVEEICIIGNGYIGVELAETLTKGGYNVKLVGSRNQILPILDEDMAQFVHKEMDQYGVRLYLGSRGKKIKDNTLVLENGHLIKAQMFIVSTGIKQNTQLLEDIGGKIGPSGGIVVDENYQTSIEDIYAIGDVIEVTNKISGKPVSLPLAFPSHRHATILAGHLYEKNTYKDTGVIGTSILRCFDLTVGSTGLNEKELKDLDISYESVYVSGPAKAHGGGGLSLKILFEKDSGKLLGAQVVGRDGVDKRLDIIASIIFMGGDIQDLWNNERAYMPEYSTTKDITNVAGNRAIEVLNGSYKKVSMLELRDLVEEGAYILDTRSQKSFDKIHIKGSTHIELDKLRDQLKDLPKDKTIYTLSSTTYKILRNSGFDVIDIEGSPKEISDIEYFKNKTNNRDSIIEEN